MRLPDNYFREKSPADIVAKVATITLANISLLGADELDRIGWLNNEVVGKLYKLGNTGLWCAKESAADGTSPVDQQINFRNASFQKSYPTYNIFDFGAQSALPAYYAQIRKLQVPITTDGGGAAANQVLIPAGAAGYKGAIEILGVISSITEATTTFVFQDEDDTVLDGCPAAGFAMNLTASTMNTQLAGVLLRGPTAAKALEVDITGHGGGGVIIFYFRYHYEA